MRAVVLGVSAVLAASISAGCVAVSAKDNQFGSERQVVVVNDRVYLIDLNSGAARELNLQTAPTLTVEVKSDR
jgi:hypothetical protein